MLGSDNFRFSGLKTAVRYLLPKLHVIRAKTRESRGVAKDEFQRGRASLRAARDDKLSAGSLRIFSAGNH